MKQVGIDKFSFGCESESYCPEWASDGGCTESRSPKFNNFNAVLIWFRNIVKRHLNDKNFKLHSYPNDEGGSSSAHIHLSARTKDFKGEYGWQIYERLYNLINMFQFFFKNSPTDKYLSVRHEKTDWCHLEKFEKGNFNFGGRYDRALTPNSLGTLEFRFNDVPKSLNQLLMYYYLVYIASKADVEIPSNGDLDVNSLEDMDKEKKKMFSYKDLESVKSYRSNYKTDILSFAEHLGKQLKGVKFWNFNNRRHCKFETFVRDCFNHDYRLFKEFKGNQKAWSDKLKARFVKKIPLQLLKEG